MFDENAKPIGSGDDAFDMLQELERNTPEEIRHQRTHFRLQIKAKVILQSGNSSELQAFRMQGVTGDLSEGGCKALFPLPVRVGDVYRLKIDDETIKVPLIFARCLRCVLLREDAFEVGFRFFSPIELPESALANARETLAS